MWSRSAVGEAKGPVIIYAQGVLEEIKGGGGALNYFWSDEGGGASRKNFLFEEGGGALKIRIYKNFASFWKPSPPRPPLFLELQIYTCNRCWHFIYHSDYL